ncbi:glycoside hydrolase family 68 protein [Natrialbaceae archaeon A-chndr2]
MSHHHTPDHETEHAPGYGAPSGWSPEQARRIERTPETTAPIVYPADEDDGSGLHIWDTWFLRTRDGSIATIDGWRVLFSLTAPADLLPGKRHDVARIRYFYSRDGQTWHCGGTLFEEGTAFGSRQWAGSALYDDGTVYCFYTAAGSREGPLSYHQRLAVGAGGSVETDETGLEILGPFDHQIMLEADGDRYETEAQSRGMIYTFRDPWFFEDPETGATHLLFEANTPVPEDADCCNGDPTRQEFNGSIGLATSPTGDPTQWQFEDPLIDAVCVNQELERPHLIVRDGRYYLFISSHRHTFEPGLEGFDALYGFVAESLRGPYRPLNDSGLVLTNPAAAAYQTYSWLAYPHREEILVSSFLNYYNLEGLSIDEVGNLPPEAQFERFGGTLAPTVRLTLDGDRTAVRGTLDHGHLPTPEEDLPPTLRGRLTDADQKGAGSYGQTGRADSSD